RLHPRVAVERMAVQLAAWLSAAMVQAVQPACAGGQERRSLGAGRRSARMAVLPAAGGGDRPRRRRAEASLFRSGQRVAPHAAVCTPARRQNLFRRTHMIRRAVSLALTLALAAPFAVSAADYSVQAGSTLGFTSNFQGSSFDGHFNKWTAAISYDPAKLASSKFDVTVDLATAKTGD